jgi:hypothetical protein
MHVAPVEALNVPAAHGVHTLAPLSLLHIAIKLVWDTSSLTDN